MAECIEITPALEQFVKKATRHFDASHDYWHALKVTKTALLILESMGNQFERDIVEFASMLHDVCDHKYPESIPKSELMDFIVESLGLAKAKRIEAIIDNTSYSKEAKGLRKELPEPDQSYSIALSDADRIEAIGIQGFERCVEFTAAKGLPPSNVLKHCHEKLLRLYPEHFIKSSKGREIALPLHLELVEHVSNLETRASPCNIRL
jgi:uncharacterized protein